MSKPLPDWTYEELLAEYTNWRRRLATFDKWGAAYSLAFKRCRRLEAEMIRRLDKESENELS